MRWKRRQRRRAQKKHQEVVVAIHLAPGTTGDHVLGPKEAPFTIALHRGRRLALDIIRSRRRFVEAPARAALDWYAEHAEHFAGVTSEPMSRAVLERLGRSA